MRIFAAEHTKENIEAMWKLCDELVAERRAHPQPDSRDLMNTMMTVADPVTGEMLSDENIRFNMVTFLVSVVDGLLHLQKADKIVDRWP